MRRIFSWILTLALVLGLAGCGQDAAAAWQEQYDLGVRYLSEGNYEEAILAFTAAIEIDAKRPEGLIGRGDAYATSSLRWKAAASSIPPVTCGERAITMGTGTWYGTIFLVIPVRAAAHR